jgi:hypothetical protein
MTPEKKHDNIISDCKKAKALSVETLTPGNAIITVVGSYFGYSTPLASFLVQHLVGLAIGLIDGANQHVLRYVFQVTSVLQPRSTGGNYRHAEKKT